MRTEGWTGLDEPVSDPVREPVEVPRFPALDVESISLQPAGTPGGTKTAGNRLFSTLLGDRRAFILRRLFATSDLLALLAAGSLATLANAVLGRAPLPDQDLALFLPLVPLWIVVASLFGLYHISDRRLDHSVVEELVPVALAATVWSWIFLLVRTGAASGGLELLPSLVIWAATIVIVLGMRSFVRLIARRQSWYRQQVAVIGTRLDIARVVRRILRHPEYGLNVARTLELQGRRLVRVVSITGGDAAVPCTGPDANGYRDTHCDFLVSSRELSAVATARGIDRVVIATEAGDMDRRTELVRSLVRAKVHVDIVPGDPDAFSPSSVVQYVEGLPVLTIPAMEARWSRSWAMVKRSFDLGVGVGALFALAPLLAYCAIRIKLGSSGKVLFRQERVGRDGRSFELLKFRTMVAEADQRKSEVASLNVHAGTETAGMFKVHGDPRITSFGGWLRRWSLDELPQLFNVVRGDMSLVGPRPLIPEEAALVAGDYMERLRVRPGITGPWQSLGRSDIGFADMVKLDYTYVAHWTFAEDLRLLVRTFGAVSKGRGAY